jgi:hypothetical protein
MLDPFKLEYLASDSCIGKIYKIYSSLLMQVSLFSKNISTSSFMVCSAQIDLNPSSSCLMFFMINLL